MFTLCGLILEARENLFRNFWSPFSISFYFSSERNKKKTNRLWAVPELDTARGQPLNSAAPSRPSPSAPPRSVRAAGAAAADDDPAARGSSCLVFRAKKRGKKFGVRRFSFSRIKSEIFLIAIPDPIFILV